MSSLGKLNELEEWLETRPFEFEAAIALRVALRGLEPILKDTASAFLTSHPFRSVNMALMYLLKTEERAKLKPLLESVTFADSITQANIAIDRMKHYEAAAARRRSRASSSNEIFADNVLNRAASETDNKYFNSKEKAKLAVAMALGQLSINLMLELRDGLGIIGSLSRVQWSRDRAPFWDCISTDCKLLENGFSIEQLFANPLWLNSRNDKKPERVERIATDSFWEYWYASFVQGAPLDWNMLFDIANIEAPDGSGEAAEQIHGIELRYLRSKAYQPERIERDEITGLFTVVPERISNQRLYDNAIRKIQEDLNLIQKSKNTNSYYAVADICEFLQNTIDFHKHEPMFVHDDFVKALKMVVGRIEKQELPLDDAIGNLVDDLNTGSIDIRAMDEGVAEAVASRVKIKIRKPGPLEERSLIDHIKLRSKQSDDALAGQMLSDANVIQSIEIDGTHETHPEPEQVIQRIANRLPQMQAEDDANTRQLGVEKMVDVTDHASKLQKGSEVVQKGAKIGLSWLQYLLSMF